MLKYQKESFDDFFVCRGDLTFFSSAKSFGMVDLPLDVMMIFNQPILNTDAPSENATYTNKILFVFKSCLYCVVSSHATVPALLSLILCYRYKCGVI